MSKNIMQAANECYLCRMELSEKGIYEKLPDKNLEEHHIMHGTANRKLAEKYGLKVKLCISHHRTGKEAVHKCRDTDLKLIQAGQKRFEELYSHEKWMQVFMKNYL